jgi:signal transduction histidine kinase
MARTTRIRPPRLTFIVALLVLTLGVASALAWQAYRAAESHRDAAERVLRDYVEFAGWEFSRASRRELDTAIDRWLNVINCAASSGSLPMPWELSTRDGCSCDDLTARTLFHVDAAGTFKFTGEPLDDDTRLWIMKSRPAADRRGPDARVVHVGRIGGRTSLFAARVVHHTGHSSNTTFAGFIADPQALGRPIGHVFGKTPLLPPALAKNAKNFVGVTVRTPTGATVFTGGASDPGVTASGRLDETIAGLEYEVSLSRAAAGDLVIGGLPRSRLPLLIGLLALTAGLLVAAALQLRREHELARLRADFVSSVSHELRTPLAQVRLFSETLLLGRVRSETEGRRSLEIIQQESRRLTHLVENVLYFSRSERGAGRLSIAPVRLGELAWELVEAFEPLARSGRSSVRLDVRSDVTAPVDAGAIRQILLNLLDNAVKYGKPDQTIVLTVDREGDTAILSVEDEGTGVPPEAAARIWEPYSRVTSAASAAIAGTGIGLAVVRELAGLHGGSARVESSPCGGAKFVIKLPGARLREDAAAGQAGSSAPERLRPERGAKPPSESAWGWGPTRSER